MPCCRCKYPPRTRRSHPALPVPDTCPFRRPCSPTESLERARRYTVLQCSLCNHLRDPVLLRRCTCPLRSFCSPPVHPGRAHQGMCRVGTLCNPLPLLYRLRHCIAPPRSSCSQRLRPVPFGLGTFPPRSSCSRPRHPGPWRRCTFPLDSPCSLWLRLAHFGRCKGQRRMAYSPMRHLAPPGRYTARPRNPCILIQCRCYRVHAPVPFGHCIDQPRNFCSLQPHLVRSGHCTIPLHTPCSHSLRPARPGRCTGLQHTLCIRRCQTRPCVRSRRCTARRHNPCSRWLGPGPSGLGIYLQNTNHNQPVLCRPGTCPPGRTCSLLRSLAQPRPGTFLQHRSCNRSPYPAPLGRCTYHSHSFCTLFVQLGLRIALPHNRHTTLGQLGRGTGPQHSPCSRRLRPDPFGPGTCPQHSPCSPSRRPAPLHRDICQFRSSCSSSAPPGQSTFLPHSHHTTPARPRPGTGPQRNPCSPIRSPALWHPGTCRHHSPCNPSRHPDLPGRYTCRFRSPCRLSAPPGPSISQLRSCRMTPVQPGHETARQRSPCSQSRDLDRRRLGTCRQHSPCSLSRHPVLFGHCIYRYHNLCTLLATAGPDTCQRRTLCKMFAVCLAATCRPHTRHKMLELPRLEIDRQRTPCNQPRHPAPPGPGICRCHSLCNLFRDPAPPGHCTCRSRNFCTPTMPLGRSTFQLGNRYMHSVQPVH